MYQSSNTSAISHPLWKLRSNWLWKGKTYDHESCHSQSQYHGRRQTQYPSLCGYPNRSSNTNWEQQKPATVDAASPPKTLAAHDTSSLTIIWQGKLKSTLMLYPPSSTPISYNQSDKSVATVMITDKYCSNASMSCFIDFYKDIRRLHDVGDS